MSGDSNALELAQMEARVAAERLALRQAFDNWIDGRREALVSVQGLAAVAASTFALGLTLRRGRGRPAQPPPGRLAATMALALTGLRLYRSYRDSFPPTGGKAAYVRRRSPGRSSAI